MKIFFSMRHSGAIRNFGSVLRGLADQGHDLHLSFVMEDKIGDERIVMELSNDYPTVTYSWLAKRTEVRWFELARAVRFTIDLLRYRLPMYADATALRARAERRVPRPARWLTKIPIFRWRWFNRGAHRALLMIERIIGHINNHKGVRWATFDEIADDFIKRSPFKGKKPAKKKKAAKKKK